MPEQMILEVVKSGIFAVLFVYLLFYILKDSKKREVKYQALIDDLCSRLEIVERIDSNVKEVKDKLHMNIKVGKMYERKV